jgi:hypothetical protein
MSERQTNSATSRIGIIDLGGVPVSARPRAGKVMRTYL